MTLGLKLAIGALSAGAIAFEIGLMRLFSISYWSHFAWMIISMAMLGYGASGALAAIVKDRAAGPEFRFWFCSASVLFGVSSIGGYLIAGVFGFNPLELLWDPWQKIRLVIIYLCLAIPFFMAGSAIGLSFARFGNESHKIYLFDLAGAGTGALLTALGLYYFFPWSLLRFIGFAGFLAGGLAMADSRLGPARPLSAMAIWMAGAVWILAWPDGALRPAVSPYKGLSAAMTSPSARIITETPSPQAWLAVVENNLAPFRHAPGLSLMDPHGPPAQLAVFSDGGGMTPITQAEEGNPPAFLENLTWALPYRLAENPRVLILGAGGGMDALMALRLGASHVDAVEINSALAEMVTGQFAGYSGGVYSNPKTRLIISEARRFVSVTDERYDVIIAPLSEAFGASVSGAGAVSENYLYTTQALGQYLERLNPGGWLAVTRWLSSPPRESLKLLAIAGGALENSGANPLQQTMVINSWNTATILVKKGIITGREIEITKSFCEQRGFDAPYYPGAAPPGPGGWNLQQEPYLYMGAAALLGGERERFIHDYKFDVSPAEDDRPYFNNFFRYGSLGELWAKGAQGGFALMEHGYLTLLMALAQAAVLFPALAGMVYILLRRRSAASRGFTPCGAYFALLGMAFMLLEMALIQKLTLFVGHPALSAAVVISSMLIFAGIGSRVSGPAGEYLTLKGTNPSAAAAIFIALSAAIHIFSVPALFNSLWAAPEPVRFAAAALSLAPVSFFMGWPFPLAMGLLARRRADLIPWAWTVNGLSSVIGALLGVALSIHFGFNAVMTLSSAMYLCAGWIYSRLRLL